jgi:hypothetical protein
MCLLRPHLEGLEVLGLGVLGTPYVTSVAPSIILDFVVFF